VKEGLWSAGRRPKAAKARTLQTLTRLLIRIPNSESINYIAVFDYEF